MGNSNRRSASAHSARKLSLSDPPLLAPIDVVESESRDAECPICFINFVALNTVTCCKQSICTGCYQQLKASGDDSSCPFCGRASMHAIYIGVTCGSTPTPTTNSAKSSIDQEEGRPLRTPQSTSKFSSPASSGGIPTASRSDREALEAEIRSQRQLFADSDPDQMSGTDSRRSEPYFLSFTSSSASSSQTRSSWTPGATPSSRARLQRRRFGRHTTDLTDDEPSHAPTNNASDASDRLLSSLQNLLGATHIDHTASLEQLEEIMLMEAIRQSMLDVQPLPQPVAAPDVRSAVSTSSSNHSGMAAGPLPPAPPQAPPLPASPSRPRGGSPPLQDQSEYDQRRSPESLLEQINRALSTPPLSPGIRSSAADVSFTWSSSREGDLLSDSDTSDA